MNTYFSFLINFQYTFLSGYTAAVNGDWWNKDRYFDGMPAMAMGPMFSDGFRDRFGDRFGDRFMFNNRFGFGVPGMGLFDRRR